MALDAAQSKAAHLVQGPRQADEARVEGAHVRAHPLDAVALRVDADEHRPQLRLCLLLCSMRECLFRDGCMHAGDPHACRVPSACLSRDSACMRGPPMHCRVLQNPPTASTAAASFSSSSGQMSGQCVKPKYSRLQAPRRSSWLKGRPSWSSSSKAPPIAGVPTDCCRPRTSAAFAFSDCSRGLCMHARLAMEKSSTCKLLLLQVVVVPHEAAGGAQRQRQAQVRHRLYWQFEKRWVVSPAMHAAWVACIGAHAHREP